MLPDNTELLADLYGKDIIAFGTGRTGKIVVPYLAQIPGIRLHGVTNSRIKAEETGTFLNTNLPLYSIDRWAELLPDATILITTVVPAGIKQIREICTRAGFCEMIVVSSELLDAAADALNQEVNLFSVRQMNDAADRIALTGNPMLRLMCLANEIRDVHKASFAEFRACHKGKDVAIVATGPTLNYYSQLKGVPHIGVNASFLREDIKLDFYFIFHYLRISSWFDELKKHSFVKFFGESQTNDLDDKFPEYIIEENHARRFFHGELSKTIHPNIEYYPLMGFHSIIFSAVHFALYTRPKRLFLIGCDCTDGGYYNDTERSKQTMVTPVWFEGYRRVKEFTARHYPDTEIISVNPVGLKGMFRDVYTESYLDMHPEIDGAGVEILNSAEPGTGNDTKQ